MKIMINGQEFNPNAPINSWEDLIAQIGCQPDVAGGMVTRIAIDGIPVDFAENEESLTPPEMKGELVEITVENPVIILQRSLIDGAELLSLMKEEALGAAESFRLGKDAQGQEQFSMVLEKVGLFMEYIGEIFRFIEASFDGFTGGLQVQELIAGLREAMKKTIVCQENRDHVQLADVMEFEIVSLLEQWREFLTSTHFSLEG
jgi:hypothetical protein